MMAGGWIVIGLAIWLLAAVTAALMLGLRSTRSRRGQASSRIWLARGRVSPLRADACRQHGRRIDRDGPPAPAEVRDGVPVPDDGAGRHRLHDPEPPPGLPVHS